MIVRFALSSPAWENAEARWALEQIAPLLDLPWRISREDDAARDGELAVWVGEPARAPAEVAAVVPCSGWAERWDPASLSLATFEGEPLLCPGGAIAPPPDRRQVPGPWLRSIFHLLSREEEGLDPRRDQWQCYSGFFTRLHALGVIGRPLVDLAARQLRSRLDEAARAKGGTLESVPRWRNGAAFAAALGHDVDDVRLYSLRQAFRLIGQGRSLRDTSVRHGLLAPFHRGPDPYAAFDRWATEEDRRGFRSTFYVCPPRPTRRHRYDAAYTLEDPVPFERRTVTVAEMLRTLEGRGWEIGLHGSYESHRSPDELVVQKRQIESGTGRPVEGIRQHFLRFDRDATWTAQERAGFAYDTTLGYNETPGFRAGIAAPFRPWDADGRRPRDLLELPLTLMDGALFRSLGLAPDAAERATLDHLDEVERCGGLAVLLWHPNVTDERMFPGWWRCWNAALDRLQGRGAWVAPAREICAWWGQRTERLRRT